METTDNERSVDALITPDMYRAARELCGKSLAESGAVIGLDENGMARLERGSFMLSVAEARALADFYGIALAAFYLPNVSAMADYFHGYDDED